MVGAAILREVSGPGPTAVLAARRTSPPALAGRWELPGGKVEPGEEPAEALVREVREELGCTVVVPHWLEGLSEIAPGLRLGVGVAAIVAGEPVAVEHDELRWLGPGDLDSVDWLDSDRPFLDQVHRMLVGPR